MAAYKVFVRNWWCKGPDGTLVPYPTAKKTVLAWVETEAEARAMCHEWNATHDPGPFSRKAEFEGG